MVDRWPDSDRDNGFEFAAPTPPQANPRSPLSMALMFYVVTVSAIFSACLRTLINNPAVSTRALSTAVLAGLSCGFVSGAVMGWYHFKGRFATAVASLMGILIGAAAGALALVDGQHFGELALLSFAGCWLLVVFMLGTARFSRLSS